MCTPKLCAFIAIAVIAAALAEGGGKSGGHSNGSLRGALRALERRRRAPLAFLPLAALQYPEANDYYLPNQQKRTKANRGELPKELIEELLEENQKTRPMYFEKKRSSPFRERSGKHSYQEDRLKELFLDELADEEELENQEMQRRNDAKYSELVRELWDKYKYEQEEAPAEDLYRIYEHKKINKRQLPGSYTPSGGWGPIAFKKKRSSHQRVDDGDNPNDFLYSLKFLSHNDPTAIENLKDERISNDDDDADVSKIFNTRRPDDQDYPQVELPSDRFANEEYNPIQQIDSGIEDLSPDDEDLIYDKEKRFPVAKRSTPSLNMRKRNANDKFKMFVNSGTDPRVAKELRNIFGNGIELESTHMQKPVKRSSIDEDMSHEAKPPTVAVLSHHNHDHTNDSNHDHDHTNKTEHTLSRHEHENKPPLLSSDHEHSHEEETVKETIEADISNEEATHLNIDHPIKLKKKSIDWSDYFGIDKRKKKSVNSEINPLPQFYKSKAKKLVNRYSLADLRNVVEKRSSKKADSAKMEKLNTKLKNMEQDFIDEAMSLTTHEDTKEEQELKEKILSRLAAAYSLDKMKKALKEFKTNLQAQKEMSKDPAPSVYDDEKKKRGGSGDKKIPFQASNDDIDFEGEQGAGQFLDGALKPIPKGYMGGSGMKAAPKEIEEVEGSNCPVLERIVHRCHGVDFLAGDHGQLFLPLCSLHQICYICGPSSPTQCDLIFLSEADSLCDGRSPCQQAARSAVMALRDLHDSYEDELEGQCGERSCLVEVLRSNSEWINDFKR